MARLCSEAEAVVEFDRDVASREQLMASWLNPNSRLIWKLRADGCWAAGTKTMAPRTRRLSTGVFRSAKVGSPANDDSGGRGADAGAKAHSSRQHTSDKLLSLESECRVARFHRSACLLGSHFRYILNAQSAARIFHLIVGNSKGSNGGK